MTRDVILTLSLLLVAGLIARILAELVHVPEIVLLLAAGGALGPSALDVLDVPLDSLGAQLVFTLGVSSILFYGGLNLSLLVALGVPNGDRLASVVALAILVTLSVQALPARWLARSLGLLDMG